MALYRVLVPSFIGEALRKPGDLVEIDPDAMRPGSNLEAVEAASEPAAPAKRQKPPKQE